MNPLTLVHTEASLGWGGQEIRILTEAEGMVRRGHRVILLCPREAAICAEATTRGLPVHPLPIGRKRPTGVLALRRWLKANPVDVINAHSSTDTWLAALATLTLPRGAPIVRTRHISAAVPGNLPTRWLYGKATRHVVTTGEALRRQLIHDNHLSPAHVTSVPTGIDVTYFTPGDRGEARARLGLETTGAVIGIVATLRSWKGHHYLIDAFAGLEDERARLVIVGDGPQRAVLTRRVRELQLDQRVLMPGNQHDVLPWLRALDIFVLPSYANEGVPQAVMQAMAVGLPVITTPIGSITEAVTDGVTGILVQPRDAVALRQAIGDLLSDEPLRNRLGGEAQRFACAHFTIDRMLDGMEAIFRKVCRP